jgi:hypothetical protein
VKAIYDLFKFQRLSLAGHYQFDKESTKKKKAIEVICRFDYYKYCGFQFAYAKSRNRHYRRLNTVAK